MINKDFTLYPEALELKQLGFDEPCLATIDQTDFIHINGTEYPIRGAMIYDTVDCPTYSQAFRWFREKHQLIHHMYWVYKKTYVGVDWIFHIKGINMTNNNVVPHDETRFDTYEEAELECLKQLIKIVKEGNQ
jgi:hypothetical protein